MSTTTPAQVSEQDLAALQSIVDVRDVRLQFLAETRRLGNRVMTRYAMNLVYAAQRILRRRAVRLAPGLAAELRMWRDEAALAAASAGRKRT